MRVVLQRVLGATARLDDAVVARIDEGLVLYAGFHREDSDAVAVRMAKKVAELRVFEDGDSKFGRSLVDVGGSALTVSQFMLHGDTSRGRRPNFSRRASTDDARAHYAEFVTALAGHVPVQAGPFASRLVLDVRNWGPFTMVIDL